MNELLSTYNASDILLFGFFMGILFDMIENLIFSLIDYLQNKACLVKDYEKIIYENIGTWDGDDDKEKEIIAIARNNYNEHLKKVKRMDNIFSKFSRLFKKKKKKY